MLPPQGAIRKKEKIMAAKKKATKKLKKAKSLQHTKPLMSFDKSSDFKR
jgi:hypothetical protein